MAFSNTTASACILLVTFVCFRLLASYRSRKRLPPGPPGLPILGNLLDWPRKDEWETWAKWGQRYGDLIYVNLGITNIVILNSVDTALTIFGDKGAIYSNRANMYFINKHVGWENIVLAMNDGPRVKTIRRLMLQELGSKAALDRFEPMSQEHVRRLLRDLLDDHSPQVLAQRLRTHYGSVILDATYGYQTKNQGDEVVQLMEKVFRDAGTYGKPGGILVDLFPWMERLPSWMPGTGYRELGRKLRKEFNASRDVPYEFTQGQIANGTHRPSFVASHLDDRELSAEDEDMLKHAAQIMYGAGADTTLSAGHSFFLFMILHPEIQARAQAEIDSVIGSTRLPKVSDRDHLPYVNAVISEVLRCSEIAPMGVPHALREDDVHDGFIVPAGSIVIPNIWFMCQDPRKYSHPQAFDPDRFMGTEPELDPRTYVFGFGRRICPGRFFAENNLFLQCATVLSTLNITKALDPNGNEITPPVAYWGTASRHPEAFPCKLQVRSAQAEALLNSDVA